MIKGTCNSNDFFDTFERIKHEQKLNLANNNSLDVYRLPISNNEFAYDKLESLVTNNIRNYVYSRKEVKEAIKDGKADELFNKARKKFRTLKNEKDSGAGGELGEILLYIFLETELEAKKILSKMELKTNSNDYIKGADGVFLYSYNKGDYKVFDMIIGESKIQKNLSKAINEALDSTKEHVLKGKFEVDLVNSNIFKETFNENEVDKIKNMIIPSTKNVKDKVSVSKAVGIFIGYSIDTELKGKNNIEGTIIMLNKIDNDIKKIAKIFNKQIEKKELSNYSFYIYILPFNDAQDDRVKILKEILE